jgi:hypothetical protein
LGCYDNRLSLAALSLRAAGDLEPLCGLTVYARIGDAFAWGVTAVAVLYAMLG